MRPRLQVRMALIAVLVAIRLLGAQTTAPERRGPSVIPPPRPFLNAFIATADRLKRRRYIGNGIRSIHQDSNGNSTD